MVVMGNTRYGPLGQEIHKHLKRLKWKQRDLANQAGVSQGNISKIMRGEHRASPDTLDAIGRALGVDSTHLMRLAGIPLPKERAKRHPKVEYIAQRLQDLPPNIQEDVYDALGAQLDVIYKMWESQKTTGPAN